MKLIVFIKKSLREQLRDYWVLIMALISAPLLVMIYWGMVGSGSLSYNLLVINRDNPMLTQQTGEGEKLVACAGGLKYANGQPILKTRFISDSMEAMALLQDRSAAAMIIIPADFSDKIRDTSLSARAGLLLMGDVSNPQYPVAGIMSNAALETYLEAETGLKKKVILTEQLLGGGINRTEFDSYIPGIMVFSVIMMLFSVAMLLVREVEYKTIRRIRLTGNNSFYLLAGVSLTQFVVALSSVILTYIVALMLGYHHSGNLALALLIVSLTIMSVIGIGLMFAAFARSSTFVLTAGTLPMFVLMFFTGAIYPMPRSEIFQIAGHAVAINDFLPPSFSVVALNKVLSLNAGFSDVAWEIGALSLLTLLYFFLGVLMFSRMQLNARKS